jgi:hypothetical protein
MAIAVVYLGTQPLLKGLGPLLLVAPRQKTGDLV